MQTTFRTCPNCQLKSAATEPRCPRCNYPFYTDAYKPRQPERTIPMPTPPVAQQESNAAAPGVSSWQDPLDPFPPSPFRGIDPETKRAITAYAPWIVVAVMIAIFSLPMALSNLPDNRFHISNVHFGFVDGLYDVEGEVTNKTDTRFNYAQVEINLYDSDGNQVGSTFTNLNNFEPGTTWYFHAMALERSAQSCRVMKVTAF